MRYFPAEHRLELTRRNLEVLLEKLDDPASVRTISNDGFTVTAVENEEHYSNRLPGPMYMPTRGETI